MQAQRPGQKSGGFAFGQTEKLTRRLQQLIHDYPEGLGIAKELLQNADDAGARVLHLIFDWRQHGTERLPDSRMAVLQGPALLAYNDRPFSSQDLENISEISRGGKLRSAAKTGRFGVGFNALYNVTDWPTFLTGDRLIVFDPHRSAVVEPGTEKPGFCWILNEGDCWQQFPDLMTPFEAVAELPVGTTNFPGTIFRLPLRSVEQAASSEIKNKPFTKENAQALIEEISTSREQLLIFLKYVEELHIAEIGSDGVRREMLAVVTSNPETVRVPRQRLREQLDGDIDEVLTRLESTSIAEPAAYRHEFLVRRDGRSERVSWQVVSGVFTDAEGELVAAARELDKAVPWAGAAARVSGARLRVNGQLYCSLPLPSVTGMPVHLHGYFDLNSNRSALMTEEGQTGSDRKRGQWNRLLVNRAVARAYATLIESLAGTLADDRAGDLYALWPVPCPVKPIDELPAHVARELAGRAVVRSAGDPRWVEFDKVRRLKAAWCELQEPLSLEGIALADPPLPEHVVRLVESAGVPIAPYTPGDLRAELRTRYQLGVPLDEAPRPSLRRRDWIESMLQFCLHDDPADLGGLPLALRADGRLAVFGMDTLYLAESQPREIFSSHPEWFLDAKFADRCSLKTSPAAKVVTMTPELVVVQLQHVVGCEGACIPWDPDQPDAPNARWLRRVMEYLFAEFGDSSLTLDRTRMQSLALVPGSDGNLYAPALTTTPLLAGDGTDSDTLKMVAGFDVPVVSAPPTLLRALSTFARAIRGYVYPLSAPDLVDTLAARGELPSRPQADLRRLLNFLSEPRWLSGMGAYNDDQKKRLCGLRIFPVICGECVALSEDVFRPSHPPPQLSGSFNLLQLGDGDRWLSLYEFLGVPPLDAQTLIRRFILPSYAEWSAPEKREALEWIRDHLDTAVNEIDAKREDPASLSAELAESRLILGCDGDYHTPRQVYDPRSEMVKEVLGEDVPMPDMRHYSDGASHWLKFFLDLGMVRQPNASDLVRRIDQLCQLTAATEITPHLRARLTTIYTHIVEHWTELNAAVVRIGGGAERGFTEILRSKCWLPVERDPKELEQWASGFIPDDRLYAPSEVYLAQSANLVASQRPIFRGRQPEASMSEALGFPKHVEVELLLNHFEHVMALWVREPTRLLPERWNTILQAIYRELARFVANETSERSASVRARFAQHACLWSGTRFWRPDHAFEVKVPYFGTRRVRLRPEAEILPAFRLLGLRSEPEISDFVAYFEELAREFGAAPVPAEELDIVLAAYGKFGEEVRGSGYRNNSLIVLTTANTLAPANTVFANDAYWLDGRLQTDAVLLLHADLSVSVREAGEVGSLARAIREEPRGEPAEVESPRWTETANQWEVRIRSLEFRQALERLIHHEDGAARAHDLGWLADVRVVLTEPIITDLLLHRDSGWVTVGSGTGDAFFDRTRNAFFLNVEGEGLIKEWLAEKLAQQLDDTPLSNRLPLISLLDCVPATMDARLDRLRIKRLEVFEPEDPFFSGEDDGEDISEDERVAEVNTSESKGRRLTPTPGATVPPSSPTSEIRTLYRPSTTTSTSGTPRPARPPAPAARQDRAITYVSGGLDTAHADDDPEGARTAEDKQFRIQLGQRAVEKVCKYERDHRREPKEMPHNHPGYDVESCDPATGNVRLIEVKAINGPWSPRGVAISRTQFSAAQTHGENFWLYVVEHADDKEKAKIHPVRNPAGLISQFWFDHGWRALRTDEDAHPSAKFIPGRRMEMDGVGAGVIESIELRGEMRLITLRLEDGSVARPRPFNATTMRLKD